MQLIALAAVIMVASANLNFKEFKQACLPS